MRQVGETGMTRGEELTPLQILERSVEADTATGLVLPVSTGVILGEHDPSLGTTPQHDGKPKPVILTDSRSPKRERTFN